MAAMLLCRRKRLLCDLSNRIVPSFALVLGSAPSGVLGSADGLVMALRPEMSAGDSPILVITRELLKTGVRLK